MVGIHPAFFRLRSIEISGLPKEMAVLDIYYNRRRVSLEELYEKAMLKHKASNLRSSV